MGCPHLDHSPVVHTGPGPSCCLVSPGEWADVLFKQNTQNQRTGATKDTGECRSWSLPSTACHLTGTITYTKLTPRREKGAGFPPCLRGSWESGTGTPQRFVPPRVTGGTPPLSSALLLKMARRSNANPPDGWHITCSGTMGLVGMFVELAAYGLLPLSYMGGSAHP